MGKWFKLNAISSFFFSCPIIKGKSKLLSVWNLIWEFQFIGKLPFTKLNIVQCKINRNSIGIHSPFFRPLTVIDSRQKKMFAKKNLMKKRCFHFTLQMSLADIMAANNNDAFGALTSQSIFKYLFKKKTKFDVLEGLMTMRYIDPSLVFHSECVTHHRHNIQ